MKKKIKFPVLKIPQLKLPKLFKFKGMANSLKSFYYTGITSIVVILLFFVSPKLFILKNSLFVKSVEMQNESKNNLVAVVQLVVSMYLCKLTVPHKSCIEFGVTGHPG